MLKKLGNKIRLRRAVREEQMEKTPTHFDHAVFEWIAPEYLQYHKDIKWFAVFSLVIGLFGLYALAMKDYTFALAILLFGVVYCFTHRDKPKPVKVVLSQMGVKFGNQIFPYDQIRTFWIIYAPPYKQTINFRLDKKFLPDIEIFLNHQDPAQVREFLENHLPEWIDRKETFTEALIRHMRL